MAQRTVHYTFGVLLSGDMEQKDRSRFLLGSLLPDAYSMKPERELTHYTERDLGLGTVWFDFGKFREEFSSEVRSDPLYLGYYMHILEDDLHRQVIHGAGEEKMTPKNDRELALLYRDYHILNRRFRALYDLKDELVLPPDFETLPINRRVPLNAAGMIDDLRADLLDDLDAPLTMLPEGLTEAFVTDSLPTLKTEMAAVLRGETTLCARDFMWKRHMRYN